ncbi:FHA domain-containing protein [Merismopedia glauca]|uniref:FHA domain-containing protein n=1 Tax=Merismopedia glauca CCAP 1448/3 TaxID=1296344 RepID=A0A2T1C8R6_9CYAN|nr:FHA domain-containing protein [Merismopedia glauca]PSB04646.1 hypothetical protein C7B64_02895 [Merismopedia glauca CCAP 1448/3]
MSAKTEKLAQKIQDVKKFVLAKENRYLSFSAIATELDSLLTCLQTQKLNLKIISRYPILSQAVQNLINRNDELKPLYYLQTETLAGIKLETEAKSPASLLLKGDPSNKTQKTRYLLSLEQKVAIGRSLDCQIQLPVDCTTVSRHHAEIRPFLNSGANKPTVSWVVYDLNSANGTYVNDISLKGNSRALTNGDRIILGKYHDCTGPEFVFEDRSTSVTSPEDELKQLLKGGDMLGLVINPIQPLSREEKTVISLAQKAKFVKIILIADTSAALQNQEIIQTNLAEIKVWQNSEKLNDILIIKSLPLKSFYHQEQSFIDAEVQQDIDSFSRLMQQLLAERGEDLIKDRVKSQFLAQLSLIDTVFDEKLATLKQELEQQQKSLGGKTLEELSEQLKKAVKQVNEERERTIPQIKFEFNESKLSLVDAYQKHSLIYKIKVFADELKAIVTERNGEKIIILKTDKMQDEETIHNYATRLCNVEIFKWSTQEWERICQNYANGGLKEFFQKTYNILSFLHNLDLDNSLFKPADKFDVSKCLRESFLEFEKTHISLPETSKKGDFILGGGAVIGAVIGAGANPMAIPLLLIQPVAMLLTRDDARQQALLNRKEQQIEGFRKGVFSHYQNFAKSMTEKVARNFTLGFQTEERRWKELVEQSIEKINSHLAQTKKSLAENNSKQNQIAKEKAELLDIIKKP